MKRNSLTVPIRRFDAASSLTEQDWVAVEEPLEIVLNDKNIAITMRTPGQDRELAAGFLFTEGILSQPPESIEIKENRVEIRASATVDFPARNFYLSSSCGICGKASIQALESMGCPFLNRAEPKIDVELVCRLPDALRERQSVFDRTGGLHAAALFDTGGNLLDLKEDVGRHNALDKIIGAAFLEGRTPLDGNVLMLSGRASFELIQKALMAQIGIVAAVGAPSSLAVDAALRYGMTLIGFVRGARFNVYSGESRLVIPSSARPSGPPSS